VVKLPRTLNGGQIHRSELSIFSQHIEQVLHIFGQRGFKFHRFFVLERLNSSFQA
jgi:hypothetical protein